MASRSEGGQYYTKHIIYYTMLCSARLYYTIVMSGALGRLRFQAMRVRPAAQVMFAQGQPYIKR